MYIFSDSYHQIFLPQLPMYQSTTFTQESMTGKKHLNLVMVGSTDSGKSTMIGYFIYRCGGIDKRILQKLDKQAAQYHKPHFKYHWIMESYRRARDMPINRGPTFWQFLTDKKHVTIIDTPGYRNFMRGRIKGISQADCAILMVKTYIQDALVQKEQIKEQLLLIYSLGIKHLIICLNKMDDDLVEYPKERYQEIKSQISILLQNFGYKLQNIPFVPICTITGQNLIERSEKMDWYEGPTVIGAIDLQETQQRLIDKPLRIPIIDVYKIGGIGTVAIGKIVSGVLKNNMKVRIEPGNKQSQIKSIQIHHRQVERAQTGDIVGFNINVSKNQIKRGYLIGNSEDPPKIVKQLIAKIIIFNHPSSIRKGYTPLVHCHTSSIGWKLQKIIAKINIKTEGVIEQRPTSLRKGDCGLVLMKPIKQLCCETYREYGELGRFVMEDMKEIVGVGIIKEVVGKNE